MKKFLLHFYSSFQKEYFLFLLPLFFVFHGFNEHYGKIPTGDIFLLLMKYLLAIAVLVVLFSFLFRSFRKASVFTFVFFFVYLFYGTVHDWIKVVFPGALIASYRFILPFLVLFFSGLFLYLVKTNHQFSRLVTYLNVLLLLLCGIELAGLAFIKPPFTAIIEQATTRSTTAQALRPCDTCIKEDIHLIILDEYAGEKQLKEEFHFDNSAFLESLKSRGFHVVAGARGNYNYTELSTASLLSLDYLGDLNGKNDNELYNIGSSVINSNIFTSYLQELGYEIHNFSIFDVQGIPALNNHFKPEVKLISGQTLLSRLEFDLGFHLLYTMPMDFALKSLSRTIEQGAAQNGNTMDTLLYTLAQRQGSRPQFYYTHLLMPHVPYYFDREGQFTGLQRYLNPGDPAQRKRDYLEYLQYTNKKVLAFVDTILKKSVRAPVILLMSDHGNRHYTLKKDSHFSSLNALYFPDRHYDGFYPGISNVNQLRVFVNNRFHQKLPLLKDTTFYLGKGITYH